MVAFKEKISDSVSAVSKAKDAINWIKTYLNRAKTDLNNILGSSSSADRTTTAASFDGHLSNIHGKVNGANQLVGFNNINLIGNTEGPDWKTDDIYTPTSNAGGGILEIKGAFLGVDFQVTDTNGLHWRLDAIDKTFYQYSSDGTGKRTGMLKEALLKLMQLYLKGASILLPLKSIVLRLKKILSYQRK